MVKGKKWASEQRVFKDPISGATITQLTDYLAHSFHLYFTNNGWYDNQTKLLIGSDRGNSTNLYSVDMVTGELTQLTDYERNWTKGIQGTFINPKKSEAYFTLNKSIIALNLETYEESVLFELPEGYNFSNLSCTANGQHLCFGLTEDLSTSITSNLSGGYVGFEEMEVARPHCQICLLTIESRKVRVIHEEKRWIGHVNASPTQSNLLTFCHEGPWEKVDHRIWVLDINNGEKWKIAEGETNEYAGHEYWHEDGLRIGYHGFTESLARKDGKFLGSVKFDNTNPEVFNFPYQNMHIHSKDTELIIGDGQQTTAYHGEYYQDCLFLWKKNNQSMEGPRILCKHRGSFHIQQVHVHPCFSPDRKKILFTSDMNGYGNVYLVDVPEYDSLPMLESGKLINTRN